MRVVILVPVLLSLLVPAAVAQPDEAPAATAAPDIVRLKNGGMLRGTITELVPDQYVVIVLLSGEVRRVDMAKVRFAGPAAEEKREAAVPGEPQRESDAPGSEKEPVRPLVTVHGTPARLKLRGNEPDLTFHIRGDSAASVYNFAISYQPICMAPCEATLPAGKHVLALSRRYGVAIEAMDPVEISGDAIVEGQYHSRQTVRSVGSLIALAGLVGGIAYTAQNDDFSSGTYWGVFGAILGVSLTGMIISYVPDKATFTVRPLP